ncbi:MAG TPA: cytochrome C, partial [Terriglobales bacterium]|nr:cytochrome C [Terriglobales bacterium]
MAQTFHRISNTISRLTLIGGVAVVGLLVLAAAEYYRSPYVTEVGVPRTQPAPFSHKHHVNDDGID